MWLELFGSLIILFLLHKVFYFCYWTDAKYLAIAAEKRRKRTEAIEVFKQKHPIETVGSETEQEEILNRSAEAVVHGITEERRFTAKQVMLTYIWAAIRAHEATNCLTEIMFEDALAEAEALDASFKKTRKAKGLLHGLPISLKDTVAVAGYDSTIGMIKMAFRPKTRTAPVVEILRAAGGIPFVKTNVPQTLMTFECRNPVWGETSNPHKPGFSPGGSSGGEAALIGKGGSPLGIGSDIGGSLRIPAHYSGVCAIKPSFNRICFSESQCYYPATLMINTVNGPMARTVDDLVVLSRVLMGTVSGDFRTIPFPFSMDKFGKDKARRLRIGFMRTDGFSPPSPPVQRALETAKEALEKAGHTLVEFEMPVDIVKAIGFFYGLISADGGHHYLESLRGEPLDPSMKPFVVNMHLSPIVHKVVAWLGSMVTRDGRLHELLGQTVTKPVKDLVSLQGGRVELCKAFDRAWIASGIDVLLCPPNALPAVPYGTFTELNFATTYTVLWNLLDYSAGVISPVVKVDPSIDGPPVPYSEQPGIRSPRFLDSRLQKYYRPEEMAGLPVGVQIVGPPYTEELVLAAMKSCQDALKGA